MRNRVEVMHGVNLDQLGRRDPEHYGRLTLDELERQIFDAAAGLRLETRFFRSNHEGQFVEHLHLLAGMADGILINPGAWTHYSYAIRAQHSSAITDSRRHASRESTSDRWTSTAGRPVSSSASRIA